MATYETHEGEVVPAILRPAGCAMNDPYFIDFSEHAQSKRGRTLPEPVSVLADLAAGIADAVYGLNKTVHVCPSARRDDVTTLLRLHERHSMELHEALDRTRGAENQLLTLGHAVREAVADRRGYFDGFSADTMRHVAEGERRLLKLYESAIEKTQDLGGLAGLLDHHKTALINHFKAMRAAR